MKTAYLIGLLILILSCNDNGTSPKHEEIILEKAQISGKIDTETVQLTSNDSNIVDINTQMINTLEGSTMSVPVVYFHSNFQMMNKNNSSEVYRLINNKFDQKVDWRTLSANEKFAKLKETFSANSNGWQFFMTKKQYLSSAITKVIDSQEIAVPAKYNGSTFEKGLLVTFQTKGYCKNANNVNDSIYVDLALKTRVLVNDRWQTSEQLPL